MTIPFVKARNYTRVWLPRRHIDIIVIHDMEYPERPTGAEWCAQYFAGKNAPKASAHYYVDNNSVVQGVWDRDVAWAAPGANHNGIQIEHAGFAAQSRAEWLDAYSRAELKRSAALVADLCRKHKIPVRRLRAEDLRNGKRGITGHLDVNAAFHLSDHGDPGVSFPWTVYLDWVKASAK